MLFISGRFTSSSIQSPLGFGNLHKDFIFSQKSEEGDAKNKHGGCKSCGDKKSLTQSTYLVCVPKIHFLLIMIALFCYQRWIK